MISIYHDIMDELKHSDLKHGPMQGRVEGLHTLKCEVAELEREVMREFKDPEAMRKEAIQVGAMVFKFMRDVL